MVSRSEKETILRIAEDEKDWTVFTESASFIKKLERTGQIGRKDGAGVRFTIPRKLISIKRPRIITDSQKQAMRERFAKNKEAK